MQRKETAELGIGKQFLQLVVVLSVLPFTLPPPCTFYSCFAATVLQVESRRRACALPMSLLGFVPGIKWISQWSHRQPWPISSVCVCVCAIKSVCRLRVCFFNTRSYLVNNSSCSRHRSCALFLTLLLLPIGNGHANCLFILAYIHKLQQKSRICYRNYIVKCFIWSALSLVCGQPEHNTENPWYKQKQNASSFCMLHFPLINATKFYFHYKESNTWLFNTLYNILNNS